MFIEAVFLGIQFGKMRRYIVLHISILFFLFLYFDTISGLITGSYRYIPKKTRMCSHKEALNPHSDLGQFLNFTNEFYNISGKTYVRANYTFMRRIQNAKLRMRYYFWEDDQWKLRLFIPGWSCDRKIMYLVLTALRMDVDEKCTVAKGTFTMDHFDYNRLMHLWGADTEYGQWMSIIELTSNSKAVCCFVLDSEVVPITQKAVP